MPVMYDIDTPLCLMCVQMPVRPTWQQRWQGRAEVGDPGPDAQRLSEDAQTADRCLLEDLEGRGHCLLEGVSDRGWQNLNEARLNDCFTVERLGAGF